MPLHTVSERQRNSNPRKLYPADPGLIQAFDVSGHTNVGHALETAIFNELEQRGADVSYAKTAEGFEVEGISESTGSVVGAHPGAGRGGCLKCVQRTASLRMDVGGGELGVCRVEAVRYCRKFSSKNRLIVA